MHILPVDAALRPQPVSLCSARRHHLVMDDGLRMKPFLPKLQFTLRLVRRAEGAQQMPQPLATLRLSLRDDLLRGVPLQVRHDALQIGRGEDDLGDDADALAGTAVSEGFDEAAAVLSSGLLAKPHREASVAAWLATPLKNG